MHPISVVIIAKDEAKNIVDCITSAMQISNDVIVADSGSKDDTASLAIQAGARLVATDWKGYGQTRNEAADVAANDWILSLDADERVTPQFAASINNLLLTDECLLYGCKRQNFLGTHEIRFGEWGSDTVYRLYNKKQARWDLMPVHENITGNAINKKTIPGSILHYTMKDLAEYRKKSILYAQLSAQKYLEMGKKVSVVKRFISPVFSFLQNYIFKLGFLDGKEGFMIANISSEYTYLKYKYLSLLFQKKK
jgi:glycosyltransferase involved in cell wall biosynthesis